MKFYSQITFSQVSEILMHAALGVSAVCGNSLVSSDLVYALSGLKDYVMDARMSCRPSEPYYIAIRALGTEDGLKQHCIERCNALGYPLVIAKIQMCDVCDYDMTITFTHGWNDKDNNYMEQEFNSL